MLLFVFPHSNPNAVLRLDMELHNGGSKGRSPRGNAYSTDADGPGPMREPLYTSVRSDETNMLVLPVSMYQDWFEAILENHGDAVRERLEESDSQERQRLLNGFFDYQENELCNIFSYLNHCRFRVSRPLTLAVMYGSGDVSRVLIQNGADPSLSDNEGESLLHSLVTYSNLCHTRESRMASSYMDFIENFSPEEKKELLHAENSDGLRPLEYAAKLGCTQMVRAIMETPDVYLARQDRKGMVLYQWYDVTEYMTSQGSEDRRGKTPVGFLALMTEATMRRTGTVDLFQWIPFKQWKHVHFAPNKPFILAWLLFRIIPVLMYIILLADEGLIRKAGGRTEEGRYRNAENTTAAINASGSFVYCTGVVLYRSDRNLSLWLTFFVGGFGLVTVVFDVVELLVINVRRAPRYFCHQHCFVVHTAVQSMMFRIGQFLQGGLFIVIGVTTHLTDFEDFTENFGAKLNLALMIMTTISMHFFLQLAPVLGRYVITLEWMLRDLLHFGIIYLLWVVPFSYYFMVFFNLNSVDRCVEAFSGFWRSLYSTFTIMLNMVNLSEFKVRDQILLDLMHIAYVFMIAILLINFLIALMATSATRVALCSNLVVKLEKLYIALLLEYRLRWFLPGYYDRQRRRYMVVEDGRYYLTNITYT